MSEINGITVEIIEQEDTTILVPDKGTPMSFFNTPEQKAALDKAMQKACDTIRKDLNQKALNELESTQND